MKVYAKHPIKYNGEWYMGGDEIDMSIPDLKAYEEFVDADEDADDGEDNVLVSPMVSEPVKRGRGRPRKNF